MKNELVTVSTRIYYLSINLRGATLAFFFLPYNKKYNNNKRTTSHVKDSFTLEMCSSLYGIKLIVSKCKIYKH